MYFWHLVYVMGKNGRRQQRQRDGHVDSVMKRIDGKECGASITYWTWVDVLRNMSGKSCIHDGIRVAMAWGLLSSSSAHQGACNSMIKDIPLPVMHPHGVLVVLRWSSGIDRLIGFTIDRVRVQRCCCHLAHTRYRLVCPRGVAVG
jgi:hypothetical protein